MAIPKAKNLIRLFGCYEHASGLKVNISKSQLVGLGINNFEIELLARSIQYFISNLSFVYLGLLVDATISRISQWSSLISKYQVKLSKWKTSTLSFDIRSTLCKLVLGSLGTFLFSPYNALIKLSTLLKTWEGFSFGAIRKKGKIRMVWVGKCACQTRKQGLKHR